MPILLADAGPIVGFTAGNQHHMLLHVIQRTHGSIQVPHHVDGEITRATRSKSRRAESNYQWMKAQGHVTVLPEQGIGIGDAKVVRIAATLIDQQPASMHSRTRDLGEAFTVAHAAVMAKVGPAPEVLIDDRGGLRFAKQYNLVVRNTVWVFRQAIGFGFITSTAELEKSYDDVSRHSTLPLLGSTGLVDVLR